MSVSILNVSLVSKNKNQENSYCFKYGDEQIVFERMILSSNKSHLLIKVYPDCRVIVHAPQNTLDEAVVSAVKKRSRWIFKKLFEFKSQLEYITPRLYVSGETHYYLGKQYQLKVFEYPNEKQQVKLLRGNLEIYIRSKKAAKVKQLLNEWYKERAREIFVQRVDAMLSQALWVSKRPSVRVQTMQTQWGSCSPNGSLTLNPHLVKAPRECIDYVILHELCHIAEHNHSKRFYRLMKQVMPHWEKVKDRLDSKAMMLLN